MALTKKQIGIIAGIVLLIFIIGRSCSKSGSSGSTIALFATVEEGPLVVTVRAAGEILSSDANRIIPKIKRSVQVEFLVPEGSRVKKGDVISRFSPDELDTRINESEAVLADKELLVVSTRTDLEIQELDNANTLKLAQQAVQDAEMELKKFQEGDEPTDTRAAELKIATTQSDHERSIKKHTEAGELLKEGFITEDQVEEERIAMETARVDHDSAILALQILNEYDLPLRSNKAQSALDKARTELEKTVKVNEVQGQSKRQAMDTAVRSRDRAKTELDGLRKEREDYDLRSPLDGVVNYGDPDNQWRRGDVQAGMTLNPGEVLITIPDMSVMQANANVPEADIDKIKSGQSATIYVEAMGRKTFSGTVARVAEVANPGGWMSSDVKEFKVQIKIPNGDGLRPGFTCDADITVDKIDNTLLLPIQAVFRDGDQWIVYRGSSSSAKKSPVTIGRSSITHVQILDGLKKGDRVILNPPGELK